jgi:hypothetical protein
MKTKPRSWPRELTQFDHLPTTPTPKQKPPISLVDWADRHLEIYGRKLEICEILGEPEEHRYFALVMHLQKLLGLGYRRPEELEEQLVFNFACTEAAAAGDIESKGAGNDFI